MRKYITKASERIGVESTSRDGKRAQVVSYSTCENFIIRFCDGKEMKLKNWRYFIEGNFNYEKHFKASRNREERIGEKKVMNNGLTAEVIEYRGSHDMDILFEDGGKRTGVSWRDFCIGSIAHPTIPGGNVSQNELVLRFYLWLQKSLKCLVVEISLYSSRMEKLYIINVIKVLLKEIFHIPKIQVWQKRIKD